MVSPFSLARGAWIAEAQLSLPASFVGGDPAREVSVFFMPDVRLDFLGKVLVSSVAIIKAPQIHLVFLPAIPAIHPG